MYRAIAKNKRNTVFIIILFVIIIGFLGFALSFLMGGDPLTVTIGTVVGAGIFTVIQYFAASRQALSISGAIESSVNEREALPGFPSASAARTLKECAP